ncbi:MAG: hypothetical protein ACRC9K_16185 [Afipia sp.]
MRSFNVVERLRNIVRRHRDSQQSIYGELQAIRMLLSYGYGSPGNAAYGRLIDDVIAADGRYADPLCLARFSASMSSQVGEDGIIAEIFNRIGRKDRTFVEIGVENGTQNTTRFLLESGWTGTWIEGSEKDANAARQFMQSYVDNGRLKIIHASVTAENVNDLFDRAETPDVIDYLSIDIDYNTPHVWSALRRKSRVACIEYNGHLPCNVAMSVPYEPNRVWDGHTVWFGGSLKAMENIGRKKGMSLVGCDLIGINSFFVSSDEATGKFRAPFTAENHYQRARAHNVLPYSISAPHQRWVVED